MILLWLIYNMSLRDVSASFASDRLALFCQFKSEDFIANDVA